MRHASPLLVLAAHQYPPESSYGTARADFVRGVAHDLKAGDPAAVRIAAAALAPLVPRGATLVPVPGSRGSTRPNLALAEAVARLAGGRVRDDLERRPSESQYDRRKRGLAPLRAEEMDVRWGGAPLRGVVVLVDNVVTTGATATSARQAVGGDAVLLAWADAQHLHRAATVRAVPRLRKANAAAGAPGRREPRSRRLAEYKVRVMRWRREPDSFLFCRQWYKVAEFPESDVAGLRAYLKREGITRDDFGKRDDVRLYIGSRRVRKADVPDWVG